MSAGNVKVIEAIYKMPFVKISLVRATSGTAIYRGGAGNKV